MPHRFVELIKSFHKERKVKIRLDGVAVEEISVDKFKINHSFIQKRIQFIHTVYLILHNEIISIIATRIIISLHKSTIKSV